MAKLKKLPIFSPKKIFNVITTENNVWVLLYFLKLIESLIEDTKSLNYIFIRRKFKTQEKIFTKTIGQSHKDHELNSETII